MPKGEVSYLLKIFLFYSGHRPELLVMFLQYLFRSPSWLPTFATTFFPLIKHFYIFRSLAESNLLYGV